MSVKRYGVFAAWAPNSVLTGEGLGRYLAQLLKAAQDRDDIRLTVLCSKWSRQALEDLCKEEQINLDHFDILTPGTSPIVWRILSKFKRGKKQKKRQRFFFRQISNLIVGKLTKFSENILNQIVSARNIFAFTFASLFGLTALILAAPFLVVGGPVFAVYKLFDIFVGFEKNLQISRRLANLFKRLQNRFGTKEKVLATTLPNSSRNQKTLGQLNSNFRSMFAYPLNIMMQNEAKQLASIANLQKDIAAWYSPMALWPEFNDISGKRVMCVPDVVTSEFAVGFGGAGGSSMIENHKRMIKAIDGADQLVTYSETIKWDVLIDRLGIAPRNVHVIRHAPSRVDAYIELTGFKAVESATKAHCISLLDRAIHRNAKDSVMQLATIADTEFLFYPSQFRPNKNILTLLRAFSNVLRVENRGCKLILTGDAASAKEIENFVSENNLSRDVIILNRLSVEELAACYKLAKLAINPSLSEGGCPFTFTEAVSVGTPVVMARIHVTEEVIVEEALNRDMLFDPFDWLDMSNRICWALDNRDDLLTRQLELFQSLTSSRNWTNVLDEHLNIMDINPR